MVTSLATLHVRQVEHRQNLLEYRGFFTVQQQVSRHSGEAEHALKGNTRRPGTHERVSKGKYLWTPPCSRGRLKLKQCQGT